MRIGFDVRCFLKEETGVGIYFKNLLFHLAQIDQSNEYFIFSSSLKDRFPLHKVPPFSKKKFLDLRLPVKAVNFFWYKLCWPPLDFFFKTDMDLTHSPVPLILPTKGKKIVTIHHAFPDHGEGFCVFNDVAVALEKMKHEGKIEKAMVVDCDLHQGNGTSFILAKKDYAFTFSIHQMDNYPAEKPSSSVDIGLWSGDGDEKYLPLIRSHFPSLYIEYKPDLIFYLAGADPYEDDQLGNLRLTMEGLIERDRIIIGEARRLGLPLVILLAGGYAKDVADTVSVHLNTIKTAQRIQRKYY